jgi:unsaturated rhamnogalacturonyl hydrolase
MAGKPALNPDGYEHGEVSGSGFFTYALAWGINNGILNEDEYKPVVMKAWKALRECQHDDGMVGWVQNIGDSPSLPIKTVGKITEQVLSYWLVVK